MNKREEGKADRRRRIVMAARDLIRETGGAGLSMRAIAARAQVSLATPYNLFGSKRAIVLAVLDDVRAFNERLAGLEAATAIDRIFGALSLSVGFYVDDPVFYRTLWTAVFDANGKELRSAIFTPQNSAFWSSLIAEAVRDGTLSADRDQQVLRRGLGLTFHAVMLNWVIGDLPVEALEPSVGYGYAMGLAGAATDAARPALLERVAAYEAALAALGATPQAA